VINGRKSWFSLWWERDESFFLPGAKIIFAARTLGRNFTYTDEAFYASRNCFFIKSSRINLKNLTGLLNSTMMYYYMHQTIKHNGDLLQLDKVQFLSIPLYKPTAEIQNEIARIVDQILCAKCKHQNLDTSALEQEIDRLVYKLYNLTDEEIALIEQ
jgi:adenine-specific DNA-methyltransferase